MQIHSAYRHCLLDLRPAVFDFCKSVDCRAVSRSVSVNIEISVAFGSLKSYFDKVTRFERSAYSYNVTGLLNEFQFAVFDRSIAIVGFEYIFILGIRKSPYTTRFIFSRNSLGCRTFTIDCINDNAYNIIFFGCICKRTKALRYGKIYNRTRRLKSPPDGKSR